MEICINKRVKIEELMLLLNDTYWAKNRDQATMIKALEHSETISIFDQEKLVGFLRVVTDYATMFYLCDVIVHKEYRGKGVGKQLMASLMSQPYYKSLKGFLATKDAHGLYAQYGFDVESEKVMVKDRE